MQMFSIEHRTHYSQHMERFFLGETFVANLREHESSEIKVTFSYSDGFGDRSKIKSRQSRVRWMTFTRTIDGLEADGPYLIIKESQ